MNRRSFDIFFLSLIFFGVTIFFVLFNTNCSNPQIIPSQDDANNFVFESDNADLTNLIVLNEDGNDLELIPSFNKDIVNYKVNISPLTESIILSPSISDKKKALAFIGSVKVLDKSSQTYNISGDSTTIEIKVIAEDKTEKIYRINFVKASNSAYLKGITTDKGELSPIFSKDRLTYNLTLANSVSTCKITPVLEDSAASYKMLLDGVQIAKGSDLNLNVGNNALTIEVTSKDNSTTKNYTVTINRANLGVSNIANLSGITLSKGVLSPSFSKNTEEYNVTLGLDVTEVNVTATTEDTKSTVVFSKTMPMALTQGKNTVKITVTAEDGTNKKDYTINFNVESTESNAFLASLSFSNVTLETSFDKNTYNYKSTVSNSVNSTKITYQSDATGQIVTLKKDSNSVNINDTHSLNVGDNIFEVSVKSKDNSVTKVYKATIKRLSVAVSSNADLSSLTLKKSDNSNISYTPSFDKDSTSYSVTVLNSVSSVKVTPTVSDVNAKLSVNGAVKSSGSSVEISLSEGSNTIEVEVKAEDNTTTKTYYINVTREGMTTTTTTVSPVTTTTVAITDRIILHAKNYGWVYLWTTSDASLNDKRHEMTSEGNNWSTITIMVTSANIIFTPGNSWTGQTVDLSRTAGEWWYKDGTWTNYNPEGPKTPVITATPEAKTYLVGQSVTLSGSNLTDEIYYTLDGSTPSISSTKYTSAISVSSTKTIKAIGYNSGASPQWGSVATFSYVIDPDADFVAPTITPSKEAGVYPTSTNVNFKITDNKSATTKVYYTTDGTLPTTSSQIYKQGDASGSGMTGSDITIPLNQGKSISLLAVDGSGNETRGSYYYYCGVITSTRFDPRQESIYFLLTSRWFDGDTSNSVGDEWCSYTLERWNKSPDHGGFTGPEDVTWRGDFKGLVEKMDYIKALGFTAIWITPVVQNRSPLAYHGYHGWDFTKEDARLESPGYDFQRVINEAHARDMKICLDIVINHSGRFGIKNFSEIKYNRDSNLYPVPAGWEGFTWNESKYLSGQEQNFPNNWQYDGLKSPGNYPVGHPKEGQPIPPYATFTRDVRPFTASDIATYGLNTMANGFLKFQWPSTESYCKTIDGVGTPGSLTYEGYKSSARRHRGHNTGFPTGSGSFDNFPDAHFDSAHEDCPDLNTENPDVQNYMLNAYNRYIDMGVDMFRVDTVMHIHKSTLNDMYWPQLLTRADQKKAMRGGGDFFMFGEVANFVSNPTDKASQLREQNYTFDNSTNDTSGNNNHLLNGNSYRTPDYSHKAPNASAPGHVSVINMIAHNSFCNGHASGYNAALSNDHLYNDATFMPWYADSHDYGPNKGTTRYSGDFKPLWSMLFTFRGIPVVYYGSEIRFKQGLPNDWPGGGSAGTDMSLEKTGRGYYGGHLQGTVTASGFGDYTASGEVATTLNSVESQHLMRLNKIRLAVPALQMGQYSTDGCSGGWASFKRRYTGTNKITSQPIDSYCVVGIGAGNHSYTGILNGKYIDCVTGDVKNVTGGTLSFNVPGDDSNLRVYVLDDLTTKAPGKVVTASSTIF